MEKITFLINQNGSGISLGISVGIRQDVSRKADQHEQQSKTADILLRD